MPGTIAGRADRQHHRHFDQNADDRRQRRAGFRAEGYYLTTARHGRDIYMRAATIGKDAWNNYLDVFLCAVARS